MAPGDERRRSQRKPGKKAANSTPIKFATWNVGHLSEDNEHREEKLEHLKNMIAEQQPDVLSLQEINSDISEHLRNAAGDDYELHMGPLMEAGSNNYNNRQGTQHEYYPLLVKKSAGLNVTPLGMLHVEGGGRVKGKNKDSVAWGSARPMATYLMTHQETQRSAVLGAAHTSPGSFTEKQIKEHYRGLKALGEKMNMPFFGMGDWYGKENKGIPAKHLRRSPNSTNYAEGQDENRQAADYFLTNLPSEDPQVHGKPKDLFEDKISDHSPVSITASLNGFPQSETHEQLAEKATDWVQKMNLVRSGEMFDEYGYKGLARDLNGAKRRSKRTRKRTRVEYEAGMNDQEDQVIEPHRKKAKRR